METGAVSLEVQLAGLDRTQRLVAGLPRAYMAGAKDGLRKAALTVLRRSREYYLTAPPGYSFTRLHSVTGKLRQSILASPPEQASYGYRVRVGSRRNWPSKPYARIHEYGGPIKRGGRQVGRMPERSYLRTALRDMREKINELMRAEVLAAKRKAGG